LHGNKETLMTPNPSSLARSPARAQPSRSITEVEMSSPISGWWGVIATVALLVAGAWLFLMGDLLIAVPLVFGALFIFRGQLTLQPNEAAALVLFGEYRATLRRDGFFWVNPFYKRVRITLKTRNFITPTLKVNDAGGNPIEVAAVVSWKVRDTAQALFDVENYENYLQVQSETGLREVAGSAAYDGADHEFTLRGNFDKVAQRLCDKIQQHVDNAGVEVLEAKLTHLAYAPEIASVMLRRQQAEAIVQAREKMVQGSIGMIALALNQLESEHIVALTPDQKSAMALNMMAVLLSESGAQPVVSLGRG
jgi:regulator of protease activity HflC (stomatin/prohibitin superfamily)